MSEYLRPIHIEENSPPNYDLEVKKLHESCDGPLVHQIFDLIEEAKNGRLDGPNRKLMSPLAGTNTGDYLNRTIFCLLAPLANITLLQDNPRINYVAALSNGSSLRRFH